MGALSEKHPGFRPWRCEDLFHVGINISKLLLYHTSYLPATILYRLNGAILSFVGIGYIPILPFSQRSMIWTDSALWNQSVVILKSHNCDCLWLFGAHTGNIIWIVALTQLFGDINMKHRNTKSVMVVKAFVDCPLQAHCFLPDIGQSSEDFQRIPSQTFHIEFPPQTLRRWMALLCSGEDQWKFGKDCGRQKTGACTWLWYDPPEHLLFLGGKLHDTES